MIDEEVKKYIDNKLKKFDGIEQSIDIKIKKLSNRCFEIDRNHEKLKSLFNTNHLSNGLKSIEDSIIANQIGLNNVYEEFKRLKCASNFVDEEEMINKILNEIAESIRNRD